MDDNKTKRNDDTMPLPSETGANAAADIVRKKVEAAYQNEPDAIAEGLDIAGKSTVVLSRHQQFLSGLVNSDKSAAEIQVEWHDYYFGLSDEQKHQVWQEFYTSHSGAVAPTSVLSPAPMKTAEGSQAAKSELITKTPLKRLSASRTISDVKRHISSNVQNRPALRANRKLHSLVFGIIAGLIVLVVFLFSFFNERFIAPLIQPSRTVSNIPLIDTNAAVGSSSEIIIPKINVQIPVVYNVTSVDEDAVLNALEDGVVNYADTARPGENGNAVIVGHSSNNIFNKGRYKFAFVLLSKLDTGDTFYLQKDGQRYTYQIYEKKIVKPDDLSVLAPSSKPAVATLVTCDPPGTSINRLVVVGEQISPDIASNKQKQTDNVLATQSKVIPSNAPTLWSRFWSWMSR